MAFRMKMIAGLQEFIAEVNTRLKNALLPVGSIVMYAGKGATPPTGWLFCDGATIPNKYGTLRTLIGANTPNFTDRFPMGTNTTDDVGVSVAAGLPNIEGTINVGGVNVGSPSGAFTSPKSATTSNQINAEVIARYRTYIDFDASRSSSIYGKSDTVQPPAIMVRYIVKAE